MSAQGEDAAAGPPDIAEQQLQDRRRANDLHALGVLRPSHGVADGAGLLRPGGIAEGFRNFVEQLLRNAGVAFDQFRRVAREVPPQDLEDAARMLQRGIGLVLARSCPLRRRGLCRDRLPRRSGRACSPPAFFLLRSFVEPGIRIVFLLLLVPAGEDAAQVFGVAEIFANDHGRVGVVLHILAEVLVVLQRVVNQAAEEENVGTRAQRHPDVGHRRGAGETRVNMNDRWRRARAPPSPTGSRRDGSRPSTIP